jgi:hypothetical protein
MWSIRGAMVHRINHTTRINRAIRRGRHGTGLRDITGRVRHSGWPATARAQNSRSRNNPSNSTGAPPVLLADPDEDRIRIQRGPGAPRASPASCPRHTAQEPRRCQANRSRRPRLRRWDADDLHIDAVRTEDPGGVGQGGRGDGNSVSGVSSLPFGIRMAYTTFAGLKSAATLRPWGRSATVSTKRSRTVGGPATRLCAEIRPWENRWLSGADP